VSVVASMSSDRYNDKTILEGEAKEGGREERREGGVR